MKKFPQIINTTEEFVDIQHKQKGDAFTILWENVAKLRGMHIFLYFSTIRYFPMPIHMLNNICNNQKKTKII